MQPPILRLQPPWRLVRLEGMVASAASYPAQALVVEELGRRPWSFYPKLTFETPSWCTVPATACTPPATALAVDPFRGHGCERSELPCPGQ